MEKAQDNTQPPADVIIDLSATDCATTLSYLIAQFDDKAGQDMHARAILDHRIAHAPPENPWNITNISCGLDTISPVLLSEFNLRRGVVEKIIHCHPSETIRTFSQEIADELRLPRERLQIIESTSQIPSHSQDICLSSISKTLPTIDSLHAHFKELARILKKADDDDKDAPPPIAIVETLKPLNHDLATPGHNFKFCTASGDLVDPEKAIPGIHRMYLDLTHLGPPIYFAFFTPGQIKAAARDADLVPAEIIRPSDRLSESLRQRLNIPPPRVGEAGQQILGSMRGSKSTTYYTQLAYRHKNANDAPAPG